MSGRLVTRHRSILVLVLPGLPAPVAGADLGILLGSWGTCSIPCVADFNRDAVVDGADLGVMLNGWGACAG